MDVEKRLHIQQTCLDLVWRFHLYLDRLDVPGVMGLLADDAVWDQKRIGLLKGKAEIEKYVRSKKPSNSMHLISNVVIDVIDEDHAEGSMYFAYFLGEGAPDTLSPMNGPNSVGFYKDKFVRTKAGWKFAYRDPHTIFRKA